MHVCLTVCLRVFNFPSLSVLNDKISKFQNDWEAFLIKILGTEARGKIRESECVYRSRGRTVRLPDWLGIKWVTLFLDIIFFLLCRSYSRRIGRNNDKASWPRCGNSKP